jgi:hypothetical protein
MKSTFIEAIMIKKSILALRPFRAQGLNMAQIFTPRPKPKKKHFSIIFTNVCPSFKGKMFFLSWVYFRGVVSVSLVFSFRGAQS